MVEAKVIRGRWWTGRIAGQREIVGRSLSRVEYSQGCQIKRSSIDGLIGAQNPCNCHLAPIAKTRQAYLVGGVVPLIPYFSIPTAHIALMYSSIRTGVILLIFGTVKARVTGAASKGIGPFPLLLFLPLSSFSDNDARRFASTSLSVYGNYSCVEGCW
jgi:VIT1/CCC1 family predicted Fe2+/Mn2+ transporter